MRRSDILFFGVLSLSLVLVLVSLLFKINLPWLAFWWVLLIPLAFTKAFFPSSKLAQWFEKKI